MWRGARHPAHITALTLTVVHNLVWLIGSLLFVSNLHYDTIEILYWSKDWLLSYGKHPPLATWIMALATPEGSVSFVNLVVLSQICVGMSAYFIWKSARLFLSEQLAIYALIIYLLSPQANHFALQFNHNALLMPFWSATLYTGLRFIIKQDIRSGLWGGLVAGLTILVKYQGILMLVTLLMLAGLHPSRRAVFKAPGFWLGLGLAGLLVTPHVVWLASDHWSVLDYAAHARRLSVADTYSAGFTAFVQSMGNSLVGEGILVLSPLMFMVLSRGVFGLRFGLERKHLQLALIMFAMPTILLIAGAFATGQTPKQSWSLVFIPNVALATALVLKPLNGEQPASGAGLWRWPTPMLSLGLSLAQFGLFLGFLLLHEQFGSPVVAYQLKGQVLAEQINALWAGYDGHDLPCLVINDPMIPGSALLWMKTRPDVVDFASPYWAKPERIAQCLRSGGIAALTPDHPEDSVQAAVPVTCNAMARRVYIPTRFGGMSHAQPVDLLVIPPAQSAGRCPGG